MCAKPLGSSAGVFLGAALTNGLREGAERSALAKTLKRKRLPQLATARNGNRARGEARADTGIAACKATSQSSICETTLSCKTPCDPNG